VFDQFDRAIISIDTLKQDSQIRAAIEECRWDLIIIDEAHNAAKRVRSTGGHSGFFYSKVRKTTQFEAAVFA